MLYLVLLGLGLVALSASEQKCAKVGGHEKLRREAALRRLSPAMRAEAERNLAARSSGIGRNVRPARASTGARPDFRRARRQPVACPPLPWLPAEVDDAALDFIEQGVVDEGALTLAVLRDVYPVTEVGDPISWPTIAEDCAAIHALQERVRIRVARILAILNDKQADEYYGD